MKKKAEIDWSKPIGNLYRITCDGFVNEFEQVEGDRWRFRIIRR